VALRPKGFRRLMEQGFRVHGRSVGYPRPSATDAYKATGCAHRSPEQAAPDAPALIDHLRPERALPENRHATGPSTHHVRGTPIKGESAGRSCCNASRLRARPWLLDFGIIYRLIHRACRRLWVIGRFVAGAARGLNVLAAQTRNKSSPAIHALSDADALTRDLAATELTELAGADRLVIGALVGSAPVRTIYALWPWHQSNRSGT